MRRFFGRSQCVSTDGAMALARRLLAHAEARAGALGIDTLYLLTTTAERFFAARGYAVVPRHGAPPEIRTTAEFAELCPSTSMCMTKRIG